MVRRPPGASPLNPLYPAKTVKHSAGVVMVWGFFVCAGRGGLRFLSKGSTMNIQIYTEVLEDKAHCDMDRLGCTTFQQDNAPATLLAGRWPG